MRTESKYTVQVIDISKMQERAEKYLRDKEELAENQFLNAPYTPFFVVQGKNGKHYLFDNEACGSTAALEDADGQVDWYRNTNGETGQMVSFEIYPCVRSTFDYDELLELSTPVEMKRMDLAIRVFGDRLERNYAELERFLDHLA